MLDPELPIRDTPDTKHVFLDDKMTIVRLQKLDVLVKRCALQILIYG